MQAASSTVDDFWDDAEFPSRNDWLKSELWIVGKKKNAMTRKDADLSQDGELGFGMVGNERMSWFAVSWFAGGDQSVLLLIFIYYYYYYLV